MAKQKIRIRLKAYDHRVLDQSAKRIVETAERTGARVVGPVPLPTKRLRVPTRKSPCGEGTNTWDRFEMRIHKRILDIDANERAMRRIMRIKVPDNVYIEITLM